MYLYDQDRTSGVSLGIGRLGDFGNSSKKTKPDPAKAIQLEGEINNLYAKARWSGVERNYEDWLKVRDENDPSKWSIHKKAAHAAMMLGKAHSRYTRLWTARSLLNLAQGASEERDLMNGQIKRLGDYWAHVGIHLTRGSASFWVLLCAVEGNCSSAVDADSIPGFDRADVFAVDG